MTRRPAGLLSFLLFAVAGWLAPAQAQDTTPPTVSIIASEVTNSPVRAGAQRFTYFFEASDNEALAPYNGSTSGPIEYRASVSNQPYGPWRPWLVDFEYPLYIDVKCTSFHLQVRAKDAAGNYSAIISKNYAAPFPILKAPTRAQLKTAGKIESDTTVTNALLSADLDQDGTMDVIRVDPIAKKVFLHRNTEGTGATFETDATTLAFETPALFDAAVGVLRTNQTGTVYPDIALAFGGNVRVYPNQGFTGEGAFNHGTPIFLTSPDHAVGHVAIGDVTGDGHPDVVAVGDAYASPFTPALLVWAGDGAGNFENPVVYPLAISLGAAADLALGDLNGDGVADVVVSGRLSGYPCVNELLSDGEGELGDAVIDYASYFGDVPQNLVIADLNKDGKSDILLATHGTYFTGQPGSQKLNFACAAELFVNDGTGQFGQPSFFDMGGVVVANDFNAENVHSSVAAVDVNFDGVVDIVATSDFSASGKIIYPKTLFGTDGKPVVTRAFATGTFSGIGKMPSILATDLDNNGKPDLVVANNNGTSTVPSPNALSTLVNFTPGGLTTPTAFKVSVTGDAKLTDGAVSGWDWNFSTVLSAILPGLELKLQTRTADGEWEDVPGAIFTRSGVNGWKLTLTDIPLGNRQFRVAAAAVGFPTLYTPASPLVNVLAPSYNVSLTVAPVTKVSKGVATLGKAVQNLTGKVGLGEIGTYAIRVTNNGSISNFTLDAPAVGVNVKFLAMYASDADFANRITIPVVNGTYTLTGIRKGETRTVYAKVRVSSTVNLDEDDGAVEPPHTIAFSTASVANPSTSASGSLIVQPVDSKLKVVWITTNNAYGEGSFYKLMDDSAGYSGYTVKFEILPSLSSEPVTIPTSGLFGMGFPLANNIVIDGRSQAEYADFFGAPVHAYPIKMEGDAAFSENAPNLLQDTAMQLTKSGCVVQGIWFHNWMYGIRITKLEAKANSGNIVRGCKFTGIQKACVEIVDSTKNTIGGPAASDRNVFQSFDFIIDYFGDHAVRIAGPLAMANKVQNNFIGLTDNGFGVVGDGFLDAGIVVTEGANSTLIKGNVISGNIGVGLSEGIRIQGTASVPVRYTLIESNFIGTNVAGLTGLGNIVGVKLYYADNSTIGGTTLGAGNLISDNFTGISISGVSNRVLNNYIGTDYTGLVGLGNVTGIRLEPGAKLTTIGGLKVREPNIISGNETGIYVLGNDPQKPTVLNSIIGNSIGVNLEKAPLGNGTNANMDLHSGVFIFGASQTTVMNNIIANSASTGVWVEGATAVKNVIRLNSIYDNGKLGINLYQASDPESDITSNDSSIQFGNDADSGPNNLQNLPTVLSAVVTGTTVKSTTIGGAISTGANKKYAIDIYSNDTADTSFNGEGKTHLGYVLVTTDSSGLGQFTLKVKGDLTGKNISATATSFVGNTFEDTSEFGNWVIAVPPATP